MEGKASRGRTVRVDGGQSFEPANPRAGKKVKKQFHLTDEEARLVEAQAFGMRVSESEIIGNLIRAWCNDVEVKIRPGAEISFSPRK